MADVIMPLRVFYGLAMRCGKAVVCTLEVE